MTKYQQLSCLEDLGKKELENKKILVRVDFNVPLDDYLKISDDTRIIAVLDTIKYLLKNHCAIILMSHLGRPKGKIVDKLRFDPVAKYLGNLLQKKVTKLDNCIGEQVEKAVSEMKPGEIILLENLRFHQEEENNDPGFSKRLASLADIYVNDAFGTAHRAHASTVGVTLYLPSYAGFLMAKEIKSLDILLSEPQRPFVAIIGGVKVSGKIEILENFIKICEVLLIGGGMAYTFLSAQGYEVGKSILERDFMNYAKELINKAKDNNKEIILPKDVLVVREFKADAESFNVSVDKIKPDMIGMDIGEKTIKLFQQKIENARTIFWNGPLGVFEMDKFAMGTNQIAMKIADLNKKVFSVVGGGDSIAAINKLGLADKISHISTGGGASLEFLSGRKLPGIEVLNK